MTLEQLGWQLCFAAAFAPFAPRGLAPARVAREERGLYSTFSELGELPAKLPGRLRFAAAGRDELPAVGDWVALEPQPAPAHSIIHAVLPRRSAFTRKAAGRTTEAQVLAANLTHCLLVSGLDGELNLRRLERFLTLAAGSGAEPVIALNKADLCADASRALEQVARIAPGVTALAASAVTGEGLDALRAIAREGATLALLGASGVGKSSLINALLGETRQAVGGLRTGDGKGRHTTTRREFVMLPAGGILIDTPGLRELQLWGDGEGLSAAFADIEELAAGCRFEDCRHAGEPGCAVADAIARGALPAARLQSYLKLQKELRYLAEKEDHLARQNTKARWKEIAKAQRRLAKKEGQR